MKLSNNEFLFESDHLGADGLCKRLIVELELDFSRHVEDCSYELSISDEAGESVKLETLPVDEQKKLESEAERLFESIIYDEWYQNGVSAAEDWSDSQEDR